MDRIEHILNKYNDVRCVINLIRYDDVEEVDDNVIKINDVIPNKTLRSRKYFDEYLNGYVRSTCVTDGKFSYHDLRTYEIIENKVYLQIRIQADPLCVPDIIDYDYTQHYDIITLKQSDGSVEDELTYYDVNTNKIDTVVKRKRQTINNINDVIDSFLIH